MGIKFYLVDSLHTDEYAISDQEILEQSLTKFHAAQDELEQIKALRNICENMQHEDWIRYQFFMQELIEKAETTYTSGPKKLELLKAKAESLNNIGIIHGDRGEIEQELLYYERALNIHEQLGDQMGISDVYNNIGYALRSSGKVDKAIAYYEKSLAISTKLNNKAAMSLAYNNLGSVLSSLGDIQGALEYYNKSLELDEETGDKDGIAMSLVNIGNIVKNQGSGEKALEYYGKALKLQQEIGNLDGVAGCYHNFATYYGNNDEWEKALDYFAKSLVIHKKRTNRVGIAHVLSNMAVLQLRQGNFDLAVEFINEALQIKEDYNLQEGVSNAYIVAGNIRLEMGDLIEAEKYGLKAMNEANDLGYPEKISRSAILLRDIYRAKGNDTKALEMYSLHIQMRDSLNNQESIKAVAMQEAQYRYEKEKEIDELNHEKELQLQEEARARQRLVIYFSIGGLVLLIVFSVVIAKRLRISRAQTKIISEAHQEIKDSITYAKRIQGAILPPEKLIKEHLPSSFVLYKPKDIVAGDFYWLEPKNGVVYFAAADCTGHGVPGAMVSVICNNGLNRSVREYGLTEPGKILDKTRELVVREFEKSEEEVKDGMDIALCALAGNTLAYAGANNPLWIVRNGSDSIEEIKADKQPIGQFTHPEPYTTHQLELNVGDTIYVFSDGFADQFGGPKNKKFMSGKFKKLVLSVQNSPIEQHGQLLNKAFEEWRGEHEQLDDVCVWGVRV